MGPGGPPGLGLPTHYCKRYSVMEMETGDIFVSYGEGSKVTHATDFVKEEDQDLKGTKGNKKKNCGKELEGN
uniref:Uncharacterized protein n=1 Tax=Arion vulgaris TaxID=1028688 RepID=A0A0B7B3E6_9EUPU